MSHSPEKLWYCARLEFRGRKPCAGLSQHLMDGWSGRPAGRFASEALCTGGGDSGAESEGSCTGGGTCLNYAAIAWYGKVNKEKLGAISRQYYGDPYGVFLRQVPGASNWFDSRDRSS
jgi:hypothetical protein